MGADVIEQRLHVVSVLIRGKAPIKQPALKNEVGEQVDTVLGLSAPVFTTKVINPSKLRIGDHLLQRFLLRFLLRCLRRI
jgi:hypothetical protein